MVKNPVTVGVPEISPAPLMDKPAGSAPEAGASEKTIGGAPEAVSWVEYR